MAKDRHTITIQCLDCSQTGKADVEDNDGASFVNRGSERIVASVTDGFTVVKSGGNYMERAVVHCSCGANVAVS